MSLGGNVVHRHMETGYLNADFHTGTQCLWEMEEKRIYGRSPVGYSEGRCSSRASQYKPFASDRYLI